MALPDVYEIMVLHEKESSDFHLDVYVIKPNT
jgi:hypothetical protein